jgi:hypothetical protein
VHFFDELVLEHPVIGDAGRLEHRGPVATVGDFFGDEGQALAGGGVDDIGALRDQLEAGARRVDRKIVDCAHGLTLARTSVMAAANFVGPRRV